MEGRRTSAHELLLLAFVLISGAHICSADHARAVFVFGDSSVDTGNYYPINSSFVSAWKHLYGVTWPGYPFGRLSSGRIQTDYIAQILGLPSPVPYRLLNDSKYNVISPNGVNFAVAGSGVFTLFGLPKLSIQVDYLRGLISSHKYDSHHLKMSLVLVSVEGNDYGAANVTTVDGMTPFVKSVIIEMNLQLRELYNLGLRNFLVSNVLSFDCVPANVQLYGTVCGNTTMDLVSTHNKFLSEAVAELRELEDANFLILDLFSAFSRIVSKPSVYGFHKISRSCCTEHENMTGSQLGCADYDEKGRPLYHLCRSPERFLFFDWHHMTQKGWKVIMDLYYSNRGFVEDGSLSSTSLAEWLHSDHVGFRSYTPK